MDTRLLWQIFNEASQKINCCKRCRKLRKRKDVVFIFKGFTCKLNKELGEYKWNLGDGDVEGDRDDNVNENGYNRE